MTVDKLGLLPPGWSEQYDPRRDLLFYVCNINPFAPYATSVRPALPQESQNESTGAGLHGRQRSSLASSMVSGIQNVQADLPLANGAGCDIPRTTSTLSDLPQISRNHDLNDLSFPKNTAPDRKSSQSRMSTRPHRPEDDLSDSFTPPRYHSFLSNSTPDNSRRSSLSASEYDTGNLTQICTVTKLHLGLHSAPEHHKYQGPRFIKATEYERGSPSPSEAMQPQTCKVKALKLSEDPSSDVIAGPPPHIISLSTTDSVTTLFKHLTDTFPSHARFPYRVWRIDVEGVVGSIYPSSKLLAHNGVLVHQTDRTLEEAMIRTGDTFVVEFKRNEDWIAPTPPGDLEPVPFAANGFLSRCSNAPSKETVGTTGIINDITSRMASSVSVDTSGFGSSTSSAKAPEPGTHGLGRMSRNSQCTTLQSCSTSAPKVTRVDDISMVKQPPTSFVSPSPAISNRTTLPMYQSEVSRGKRRAQDISMPPNNSYQEDEDLRPTSPSAMRISTPDQCHHLDTRLDALKRCNDILVAQCMDLRKRINVLEAGTQLLSSFDQSSPEGSSRNPGNHFEASSPASPCYPVSAVEGKVANFLAAAEKLRLAMENQAAWLSDKLDAHRALTPDQKPDNEPLQPIPPPMFPCGICFEEHPEDNIARIDRCQHTYCPNCLRSYIISRIQQHRYPIFCPTCTTYESAEEDLQGISLELVQQIRIPHQDFAVLEELQLSAYSILWNCHKCKQSVFVDKQDYLSCDLISCPLPGCNSLWCKPCGQQIRLNALHTCDGSYELDELMKAKNWKYCPGCSTPIQKESGCNHLICISPGCNTHFCYLCGEKIAQSIFNREVDELIQAHYRKCTIFDDGDDEGSNESGQTDSSEHRVNPVNHYEVDEAETYQSESDYELNDAEGTGIYEDQGDYSSHSVDYDRDAYLMLGTAFASLQRRGIVLSPTSYF